MSGAPHTATPDRLAFIGAGNMAAALIAGLIRRGHPAARIVAADPATTALERLAAASGIATTRDNRQAAAGADTVVLAVKPQQMHAVAVDLAGALERDPPPLVVSIAAGIPHAALVRWCGAHVPIVRTMPNQPALVGCGASALYAPAQVDAAARARAEGLMAAVGTTVWVEREALMDVVTALSGSGPAYFFRFMELLEAAARAHGLSAAAAHTLTVETAYGAALLARAADSPLATLRERVTSAGGTTAAALAAFEAAGLAQAVSAALEAAMRRATELSLEHGAA